MSEVLLRRRLAAIAEALERLGLAQALIGLGSAGAARERLDEHSDLDFFVIADSGCKEALLSNVSWLEDVAPTAFVFRNTRDGYKWLFEDGVLCEFAVFERDELRGAAFAEGAVVWKRPDVSDDIARPSLQPVRASVDVAWEAGEALTNLLVGVRRYARGERLSAFRFVQGYALDRVITLSETLGTASPVARDAFAAERRFEQRFPSVAALLPRFAPGYASTPEAALALLDWLEANVPVNAGIARVVRRECAALLGSD